MRLSIHCKPLYCNNDGAVAVTILVSYLILARLPFLVLHFLIRVV